MSIREGRTVPIVDRCRSDARHRRVGEARAAAPRLVKSGAWDALSMESRTAGVHGSHEGASVRSVPYLISVLQQVMMRQSRKMLP